MKVSKIMWDSYFSLKAGPKVNRIKAREIKAKIIWLMYFLIKLKQVIRNT